MSYKVKGDISVTRTLQLGLQADPNNAPLPGQDGSLIFDDADNELNIFYDGAWNVYAFDCSGLSTCSLDFLQDVDTTTDSPNVGDVLVFQEDEWVPRGCDRFKTVDDYVVLESYRTGLFSGSQSFTSLTANDNTYWEQHLLPVFRRPFHLIVDYSDPTDPQFFSAGSTGGSPGSDDNNNNELYWFDKVGNLLGNANAKYTAALGDAFLHMTYDSKNQVLWALVPYNVSQNYKFSLVSIDFSLAKRQSWGVSNWPGQYDIYQGDRPPFRDMSANIVREPYKLGYHFGDWTCHGPIYFEDGQAAFPLPAGTIGWEPNTAYAANAVVYQFANNNGTLYSWTETAGGHTSNATWNAAEEARWTRANPEIGNGDGSPVFSGHGLREDILYDPFTDTLYFCAHDKGKFHFFPITHDDHPSSVTDQDNPAMNRPYVVHSTKPGFTDPPITIVIQDPPNDNATIRSVWFTPQGDVGFHIPAGEEQIWIAPFEDGAEFTRLYYDFPGELRKTASPPYAINYENMTQSGIWANIVKANACGGIYSGSSALSGSVVAAMPAGTDLTFQGAGTLLKLEADTGKATMDGLLDPTGVAFTPAASSTTPDSLWVNSADDELYHDDDKMYPVIIWDEVSSRYSFEPGKEPPQYDGDASAISDGLSSGDMYILFDGANDGQIVFVS